MLPQWYLAALKAKPFRVNMITAGVVMTAGDTLAQVLEARRDKRTFELDHVRSAKMVTWSVLGFVPINFVAYRYIERIMPDAAPSVARSASSVARSAFKVRD